MEIRDALMKDVPEIFLCCTAAFKDYIPLIRQTPGPMLEDYWESVQHCPTLVAEEDGKLLGFVLLKEGKQSFMWMDVLATFPELHGKGVGRQLLAACEERIKALGRTECRLYTHVKYERTQSIYLRNGYEIYERVQEKGFDRFYMRKQLTEKG